jgi:hypothetical protein
MLELTIQVVETLAPRMTWDCSLSATFCMGLPAKRP